MFQSVSTSARFMPIMSHLASSRESQESLFDGQPHRLTKAERHHFLQTLPLVLTRQSEKREPCSPRVTLEPADSLINSVRCVLQRGHGRIHRRQVCFSDRKSTRLNSSH